MLWQALLVFGKEVNKMGNLRSKVGEYVPDNLIADVSFPVQVGSVKLAGGQGNLLRGTVVGKNPTGLFVITDSAQNITADAILTDDIDTGVEGTEDVVTTVYISGPFNRKALIFGGTDTSEKHEELLRTKGIYLKAVL